MELLYILPKNLLSQFVGWLVHLPLPFGLSTLSIEMFAKAYKIRLDEAEKPVSAYRSIGDFFVRHLREGVRPLGTGLVVHPSDSAVSESAAIAPSAAGANDDRLIQAKGRYYSLQDFVGTADLAAKYRGGAFTTYYLCPTDYHRVHSPVAGLIKVVRHIPGNLWPVNGWSVERIESLFCVNERVLVEIETPQGMMGVMFVGATNVGEISLECWPEFRSNQPEFPSVRERHFEPGVPVEKGAGLGAFHMGSTIVLLYSREMREHLEKSGNFLATLEGLKGKQVHVRADLTQNR